MSKKQFIALNVVGGACGLLIVCDLVLALLNGRLNRSVAATRNQFGQAQQVQETAHNLVLRMAQAGKSDPALRDLLAKHGFNFNLDTNGPARPSR